VDHSCVKVASTTENGESDRGHHLPPSVKSAASLFCSVFCAPIQRIASIYQPTLAITFYLFYQG
jgi:hypothetical protein